MRNARRQSIPVGAKRRLIKAANSYIVVAVVVTELIRKDAGGISDRLLKIVHMTLFQLFCVTTDTDAGTSTTGVSVLVPVAVSLATMVRSGPTTRSDLPVMTIGANCVASSAALSCARPMPTDPNDTVIKALLAINRLVNMRNFPCSPTVILPLSDQYSAV